jgi:toxin ParE1/3/4
MAYRIKIMPRAERDLEDIYRRIQALCGSASRCPVTPENDRLRHLLYGNRPQIYRVIFRIPEKSKLVEVLHIRHGAMDSFGKEEL